MGIHFVVEIGEEVDADTLVAQVQANDEASAEAAERELLDALTWSEEPVEAPPLVHEVIGGRLSRAA